MMGAFPSLDGLRPNPDWAKLPLFDRKGWKRMPFGAFAESINERVEPSDAAEEIYVGLEHLDSQNLHIRRWGKGSDVIGTKLRFRKGDIVFGRRRAYQRKLAVAEFGGICSAHAMVVRAKPELVLPEFLPFLMMSDKFMNRAVEISVGSLSPTINWKTLKLEEFDLPPLDQQRRIAEVLWAIDEVKNRNTELSRNCNELSRQAISSALMLAGINMVPLGDLISEGPQNGLYRPAGDYGDGCPILRIDSFYDGHISTNRELKRLRIGSDDVVRYSLKIGDLLINRVNSLEFVGKCAIVEKLEEPTIFESNIMRFTVDQSRIDPKFLVRWMCLDHFRRHIVRRAKHAINQASVNQDDICCALIPLPTISAQKEILLRALQLESVAAEATESVFKLKVMSSAFLNALQSLL